jgi:integrase
MGTRHYRQRGSGSLKLRGRIWWIVYRAAGKDVRESSYSENRETAENLLKQRIGEVAAGREVGKQKATIADLCELVIEDYRVRKLRDLKNVEWRYLGNIKPAIGSVVASRFGPTQVRAYIAGRRAAGAFDATINRELSIIRRGFFLGSAEVPPIVGKAPHIPKLEEDNVRQGFIEQAEYLLVRTALPEHLKCLLVVAYHCGNRVGELRKLKWSQVDLNAGEIRIERRQAKGKRPRTIPIYGEMREWLEWQAERRAPGCDLVFHWKGKPLGSHLKGWDRAVKAAGLDGLRPHDLRRSAIRNMERAGIPRSVAMAISGHRTESVYKRYDIVADTDLRKAGERLAEYHAEQPAKLERVK